MKINIWDEPLPIWEHRFNTLKFKIDYIFKIYDINNPERKNTHKGADNNFKYLLYQIKPMHDYKDEGLFSDEVTKFEFPEKTFFLALMKRLSTQRDIRRKLQGAVIEPVDVIMTFSRTRTSMEISNIEIQG